MKYKVMWEELEEKYAISHADWLFAKRNSVASVEKFIIRRENTSEPTNSI